MRGKLWPALRARPRRLILAAVLILLLGSLRIGVRVSVDGVEIGVYAPRAVTQSLRAAEAAALEIGGEAVDLREYVSLRGCLTLSPRSRDLRRLERELLAAAPKVERLWVLYAGDAALGALDDPSVLGELQRVLVEAYTGPYTVSARLEPELTLRRSFVRSDAVLSQEELSLKLRQCVRVRTVDMAQEAFSAAQNGIVTAENAKNN